MIVCRVHYVKGFAIWTGSEVVYAKFTTGYLHSVVTSFLNELRDQSASMPKGEVISKIKERFGDSVSICDTQPTQCDIFQL